jgi:HD-like signal output (HDOD) protein
LSHADTVAEPNDAWPKDLADLRGKRVGNFVVSKFVGQGGMGAVFVAEHPALRKQVAVKFLDRWLASRADTAKRFLEEARLAAALKHPNIVDILDFGELDGCPYYVMELLLGSDLSRLVAERRKRSPRLVGEYLRQIGAGLNAAHERGVVHRDLKPANVFLLEGEPLRIKLLDFGIAKVMSATTGGAATLSGQILGTPSHMAPEQALGQARDIGPATDLYSLGAILYELLTGRPVFEHESAVALMMMHIQAPVVPVRELAPEVPEVVARVVEKCLAKRPEDRPRSARELAQVFLTGLRDATKQADATSRAVTPEKKVAVHEGITVVVPAVVISERGALTGARRDAAEPGATRPATPAQPASPRAADAPRAAPVDAVTPAGSAAAKKPVSRDAAVAPPVPAAAKRPAPGDAAADARAPATAKKPALRDVREASPMPAAAKRPASPLEAAAAKASPDASRPAPGDASAPLRAAPPPLPPSSPVVPNVPASPPPADAASPKGRTPSPSAAVATPATMAVEPGPVPPTPAAPSTDGASPSSEHAPTPPPAPARDEAADGKLDEHERATLARLLQRMQRKGDFPAFMKNVTDISHKAEYRGDYSASQLGDAILKDYALTAKLLRVVNSSYYERLGKRVNRVSRAVVVLGFDRVRSVALSIALHKNPGKKPHASELAELSVSSLVSGEIARKLAQRAGLADAEEAQVCAMFRTLGHQIVVHYLPDEYEKMLAAVAAEGITLEAAAQRLLGISLRKLAIGLIQSWHLSERLAASLLPAHPDAKARTDEERLRLVSSFSNELCEVVATSLPHQREHALGALLDRYRTSLPVPAKALGELLGAVHRSLTVRLSHVLDLDPSKSALFRNLTELTAAPETPAASDAASDATPVEPPAAADAARPSLPVVGGHDARMKRLDEIEAMLQGPHDPATALRSVLEAFASGFGFRHAILLTLHGDRSSLQAQVAVGPDAKAIEAELHVPLTALLVNNDVFSLAYETGKEVVVEDAFDEKLQGRIPTVYFEMLGSRAFVLYPCGSAKSGLKLLLADADTSAPIPTADDAACLQRFRELLGRRALSPSVLVGRPVRPFVPKRT